MPVVRRRMGGPRTAVGHLRRADVNGMSVIAPIASSRADDFIVFQIVFVE
jgi:hypothetical protein